jgi:heptaprenyl diphosphate synthase
LPLVAFFGALSLFFATLEYLFPTPPWFKLGLSNLPMLVALDFFTLPELLLLLLLKVVGQGIVNGTLASQAFVLSASGSLASFVVMYGVYRLVPRRWISLIGISLAGSIASNLVQVGLSMAWIFGPASGIIAPWFLGLGTASGLAIGWGAETLQRHSRWLRRVKNGETTPSQAP